jgi:hypothetical protein
MKRNIDLPFKYFSEKWNTDDLFNCSNPVAALLIHL